MDNNSFKTIVENRISILKEEREYHLSAAGYCSAKIDELGKLQICVDDFIKGEKKKNIEENIKKNILKDVLTDPDDARRINFFLEFMDKCGDETDFAKCRKKFGKLETVLYRKNRLWFSWKEFLADYKMWINREGRWANVLVKKE